MIYDIFSDCGEIGFFDNSHFSKLLKEKPEHIQNQFTSLCETWLKAKR